MKKFFKLSLSDKIFILVDYAILLFLLLITAYPLLYVIMSSVAAGPQSMTWYLIPKRFSWVGYESIIEYKDLWTGYANSLINMALGTVLTLAMTMCAAYPLSRPEFKFRKFAMPIFMFTMYFGGGLIPTYLLIRDLGMLNTRWALIIPGCLSVYNMIVTRTYIQSSIPNDIRESASIDGCGNIRYLISMVLPLSKPILAVIGLFTAVGIWNSYFNAILYIPMRRDLQPLGVILREILVTGTDSVELMDDLEYMMKQQERKNVMKYAVIVASSLPVMMIYPFIQKYFVKGMMIGSVKG